MAAFSSIFAGIGAAAGAGSALSGLFGGGRGGGSSGMAMMLALNAMQQEQVRQQQMNLDATRRRREVIRSSQVATANAEAAAFAQGAGNSSSLEGARSAIAGQADVNIQGIEQNRDLGNQLFSLNSMRAGMLWQKSEMEAKEQGQAALKNQLFKSAGEIGKLADFGFGKLSGAFSTAANSWNQSWDIYQVGSPT